MALKKKKTQKKSKTVTRPQASSSQKAPSKKEEPRHVRAELLDEEELPREEPDSIEPVDAEGFDLDPEEQESQLPAEVGSKALTPTTDPMAAYLQEVRKYPVLSREQEMELAKKYFETKDPEAAHALVTANLRFVVKIAAEYSKFGARLIDLVQEGNVGLLHAVREFNPYKNVRLITYAVWWIRGYIQEYLMKQYSLVKIGTTQNQKKLFYRLQKEKEALDALGESPTMALIGSRLGIPEEEVRDMAQRLRGRDVSLSPAPDGESRGGLLDMQKSESENPDEILERQEQLQILKEKIETLRPSLNEREIILLEERLLADEPLTLQEIGEKYGITREAVRQTEARLLTKIRNSLEGT